MKSADGHRVERGPHIAGANRQAAGVGAAVSVALSFCGDPGPCSHCYLLSPPEGPSLPSGAGRRAFFCFPARGWCKAHPELGPPSPDSVSGSESLGEDPRARPAQAARGAARKGGRRGWRQRLSIQARCHKNAKNADCFSLAGRRAGRQQRPNYAPTSSQRPGCSGWRGLGS